jgi:uncharacterized Fe-S cluster-containing radical SAM superfamily protein
MSGTRGKGDIVDWAEITLTHRCNQRCFFCYEDGRDLAREPSLEEVRRILDETARHAKQVVLCGLEVLLRKDVLDIVAYGRSLGLRVAVFSNGQLLATPGLVARLAEAGCNSIVVSVHFPDREVFARGARARADGFDRMLQGLRNVAAYLAEHPGALDLATESDMFVLNAGRLIEMRQTLLDALGDCPWSMRLGSLLPAKVHDIGLEHVLEPLEVRRAEIAEFVRTHPANVPLHFVKVPLCLLPPGELHRCLDVEYVARGTVLTFNHERIDAITDDPYSTSLARDLRAGMRTHPYRWVCRSCSLAVMCRYERVDWTMPQFLPTRGQKPTAFRTPTAAEVLGRLDSAPATIAAAGEVLSRLSDVPFPEEAILAAIASLPEGEGRPRLADTWSDADPVFVAELSHAGHRVPIRVSPPRRGNEPVPVGAVLDYLHLVPLAGEGTPPDVIGACLDALAGVAPALPPIEAWDGDRWFDPIIARLLRGAWQRFGAAIWPGRELAAGWRTNEARVDPRNRLHVAVAHRGGSSAEVRYDAADDGRVSVAFGTCVPGLASADCEALLAAVGARVAGRPVAVPSVPVDRLRGGGEFEVALDGGAWRLPDAGDGSPPDVLTFLVREPAAGPSRTRFRVARPREGMRYLARVGDLAVDHASADGTPPPAVFAHVLVAAAKRLAALPPSEASAPAWRDAVARLLDKVGAAGRYEWTLVCGDVRLSST